MSTPYDIVGYSSHSLDYSCLSSGWFAQRRSFQPQRCIASFGFGCYRPLSLSALVAAGPMTRCFVSMLFFNIVLGDGFSPSVSNGLVLKRKKGLISKSQVLFALWLFTMMDHTGKQICVFYWLTCSHCNAASNLLTELSSLSCNVN